MPKRTVTVNDKMQKGYRYELSPRRRGATSTLSSVPT